MRPTLFTGWVTPTYVLFFWSTYVVPDGHTQFMHGRSGSFLKTIQTRSRPQVQGPRGKNGVASPPSMNAMLRHFFRLRSQRRYDEAAILLADGSQRKDFSRTQRERLSCYERGLLLADQLGNKTASCAHFRSHLKRYPRGQYKRSIRTRLSNCR